MTGGHALVWLLSAGNFVIGMGAFVVIGMLNPMAASFGLTSAEAGQLLTIYALAYAISSPVAVAATGTWARRTVLVAGIALFGLAALLSALASTPSVLFAARSVAALGAGLFTPNAAAVAAASSTPDTRGAALSNVFFGLTLAQVFGVPAGSYIAYTFGWQVSFFIVGALAVPVLLGLWRLVPADLPFQPTRLASLGAALGDWRTMLSVLFTTTYLGAIYVVYTFLAPLLSERMGFGGRGIALTLLAFGFGAVAGNLIGGRVADRIGARRTLLALALVQVALLPLFSALPIAEPLVFALVFFWSACGWCFMAPQQSILIGLAPGRQNVVLALNAAAIYIGAAAGSAVGGAVLNGFGLDSLGAFAGFCALLALASLGLAGRAARPHLASTSRR